MMPGKDRGALTAHAEQATPTACEGVRSLAPSLCRSSADKPKGRIPDEQTTAHRHAERGCTASLVAVGPSLVKRQLEALAVPVRTRTVRHDHRTGSRQAGRYVTLSRVVTAPHARVAARDIQYDSGSAAHRPA